MPVPPFGGRCAGCGTSDWMAGEVAMMNGTAQSGYGALYHNRAAPPRNCWAVALAAGLVA